MNESDIQNVIDSARRVYDQLSTHKRLKMVNEIRGVKDIVITTRPMEVGNTYPSLDLTPEEAINHKWVNVND